MRRVIIATLVVLNFSGSVWAQARTDGPEGSEYAGYKEFDRAFSLLADFGGRIDTSGSNKEQGVVLGLGVDYFTNDLFSVMLSYNFFWADDPMHEILLSPYLTLMSYNVRLGLLVSPGFTILTAGDTRARFTLAPGAMATIAFAERFSVGLILQHSFVFDGPDFLTINAMLGYSF